MCLHHLFPRLWNRSTLGIIRWTFAWVVSLLKEINMGLSFSSLSHPDHHAKHSALPSNFNLEVARDYLVETTFGETNVAHSRRLLPEAEGDDTSCAVCLNRMQDSDQVWELGNCSHVFHRQCLERWLLYDARMTCPLCRASLINLNHETSSATPLSTSPAASTTQPSWAVEQLLYFFGDDLLRSSSYSL